jgi:hypothetical protein
LAIKRIVANIEGPPEEAARFYGDLLGLDIVMDMGWIRTYGADAQMPVQMSVMSEGGSGTPVPDISIEVGRCGAGKGAGHGDCHRVRPGG